MEETSRGQEAEDETQTSTPTSDCKQGDVTKSKQEDGQSLSTAGEEDCDGETNA